MQKERLSMQPSEANVFRAAAQLYSAYLISGRVSEGSEEQWMKKSIEDAIRMAHYTDRRIQSDDEIEGGLGGGIKGLGR